MRYPYGDAPTRYGGNDIHEYDEAVFEMWVAFKDVNTDYYYASGPLSPVYSVMLSDRHRQPTDLQLLRFNILTQRNFAYASRRVEIESGISDLLARRYP
jgi:hypothetical protein